MTPLPTYAHESARTELLALLHAHAQRHSLGRIFGGGLKVVLDETTGVGPDVVFIRTDHMTFMQPDGFYGTPDLVVEVVSSKPQLDRDVKLRKYASARIPHYWIVDPLNKALAAYRLDGDHYEVAATLEGDASFESELFPGLVIPLASLWV